MDIKLKQEGYTIQLCKYCDGWGFQENLTHDSSRVYYKCHSCNGLGRIPILTFSKSNLLDTSMNTNFKEMPIGTKVQVKIIIKAHNNEVWALGYKNNEGKIIVEGFSFDDYELVGWRVF